MFASNQTGQQLVPPVNFECLHVEAKFVFIHIKRQRVNHNALYSSGELQIQSANIIIII